MRLLTVVIGDSQVLQQHGGHVRFLLRALIVRCGQGHPERAVRLSDAESSHIFRGHVVDHLQRFFAILNKKQLCYRLRLQNKHLNRCGMVFLCTQNFKCPFCLWTLKTSRSVCIYHFFFNVLLTLHLSIILDNDQLDAHLLYFTICPLQSSTCFEHYMLIIRTLNCIDA